jgi:rhodanese-related sulfurtransferase
LREAQEKARAVAAKHGVSSVDAATVKRWLGEDDRSTYLLDVRTPEEYAQGSLPGAIHAPGGQLVQATDQWVGVRNARIVLIDSEGVRAPVVASWLEQLGCDVYVLEGGVKAALEAPRAPAPQLPELPRVSAADLKRDLGAGSCTAIDLRPSMSFRKSHVPGSRWSIRSKIVEAAGAAGRPLVLIAEEDGVAHLAAADLIEAGLKDVKLLEGGLEAWTAAGYPTETTPDLPPDAECIDYLFFVHDRHAGNREAMKQYLKWETGLIAQLDAEDRKLFKVEKP